MLCLSFKKVSAVGGVNIGTSLKKKIQCQIYAVQVTSKGSLIGRESICLFVPVTRSHCSLIIQQGH